MLHLRVLAQHCSPLRYREMPSVGHLLITVGAWCGTVSSLHDHPPALGGELDDLRAADDFNQRVVRMHSAMRLMRFEPALAGQHRRIVGVRKTDKNRPQLL